MDFSWARHSSSWQRRRWPSETQLMRQLRSTCSTSTRCWQRGVLLILPSSSPIVRFMKKFVRHQSPQYMTSLDTAGSLKQSMPRTVARPRRTMRLPPRMDSSVDLPAPFAPTTRMREPYGKEKLTSDSCRLPAPPYPYERPCVCSAGLSCALTMSSSTGRLRSTGASYSLWTHSFIRVYSGQRVPLLTSSWYSVRSFIEQQRATRALEK
mmetsp:Transcript_110344/g.312008  ORF Transcript_110344/g.312008 Transcript_110344/m.312008 type:complete len:209 (-) Transcript_110344:36-662(-)